MYLDIFTWLLTSNLGFLSLNPLLEWNSTESIHELSLTSTGFILIVLWYVLFYSFIISSNLSIYTFFDTEVMYLQILVFKVLMNLSAATDFPYLCIEYISISLSFSHFYELLWNSLTLSTHVLFGFLLDFFKIFWKALVIVIPFLSFHVYWRYQ